MLSASSSTDLSPIIASDRPIWPDCNQAWRARARAARRTRTKTATVSTAPSRPDRTPLAMAVL